MEGAQAGYNTGDRYGVQPGDTVLPDPPMTEEGALFFLSALGVQGVPKPGENGQPDVAGS